MPRIPGVKWQGEQDLFQFATTTRYPQVPGWTEPTTSKDAAEAASAGAGSLRERVFDAIRSAGPAGLTADQAASFVGRNILSVRPRVAELSAMGRITRTGERRANESGMKAAAWRSVL